jgi:hypothetical protein
MDEAHRYRAKARQNVEFLLLLQEFDGVAAATTSFRSESFPLVTSFRRLPRSPAGRASPGTADIPAGHIWASSDIPRGKAGESRVRRYRRWCLEDFEIVVEEINHAGFRAAGMARRCRHWRSIAGLKPSVVAAVLGKPYQPATGGSGGSW